MKMINRKILILLVATILFFVMGHISLADSPIITDFNVIPNTSINYTKPAYISANVIGDISYVSFMVVDNNNLAMLNKTIVFDYTNWSGINGNYQTQWDGKILEIVNQTDARTYIYPLYGHGPSLPWQINKIIVPADFKKNATSINDTVILWYDKTTYRLSNITNASSPWNIINVKRVDIEPGDSTVKMIRLEFINGIDQRYAYMISPKEYKLYNIGDSRNPYLVDRNIPTGDYKVILHVISRDDQHTVLNRDVNVLSPCDAVWDVNKDGLTNIQDIVIVGQHFGERTTQPYPAYDTNGDGIVNIQDIVIIGQHFGQSTCWV